MGSRALELIPQQQRPRLSWVALLTWLLYGAIGILLLLLFTIGDPLAPETLPIRLMCPAVLCGVLIILLVAAWEQQRTRRWCWLCQALAVLSLAVAATLDSFARVHQAQPLTRLTTALYALDYAFVLIGGALYFSRRPWWFGTTLRIVLDSVAVGCATLILLQSLLPLVLLPQPWTAFQQFLVPYLGFDAGLLFAVSVLFLRYRKHGGPLVRLVFWGVLCHLAGESISFWLLRYPNGSRWTLAVAPLELLQNVLLARGAYLSGSEPPQVPSEAPSMMPLVEWITWTQVPRMLILAAFGITTLVAPAQHETLILLPLVALAREAVAAYDQRVVMRNLYHAQGQERQVTHRMLEFLTRIVHDFGSPIQGMKSAASGLTLVGDPLLNLLQIQLTHLDNLYGQLRMYLLSRAGGLQLTPVDIVPIAVAALQAALDTAAARGIQLRFNVEATTTSVYGEATALRRIVDNLLINALEATPAGGEVVVKIQVADDKQPEALLLQVSDTGPGIPVEEHQRIFEPLVRLRPGIGMGLGLAIVYESVQAMQGACGVESTPGHGSTFWIRLPLALE